MPARARKETIRRDEVGYYHCYNRCVRRAFLCGVDPLTGNNYDHRKTWIEQRLETLAAGFAVEVCDFSAMDNHLHLVLRNRPDLVSIWSDDEVARRWWQLCPPRRDRQGHAAEPQDVELQVWLNDSDKMQELRGRLSDISWFMKLLSEHIARKANGEDQVSGKFWESRFKAVPLLDEEALLACSLYVDLNPIAQRLLLSLRAVYAAGGLQGPCWPRIEAAVTGRRGSRARRARLRLTCDPASIHAQSSHVLRISCSPRPASNWCVSCFLAAVAACSFRWARAVAFVKSGTAVRWAAWAIRHRCCPARTTRVTGRG